MAIGFMAVSGTLLWLAQKEIPMGTAYAVWTGIGASGTFLLGIWFYGDPTSLLRYMGVLLIILGVVVLKFAHEVGQFTLRYDGESRKINLTLCQPVSISR